MTADARKQLYRANAVNWKLLKTRYSTCFKRKIISPVQHTDRIMKTSIGSI